MRIAYLLYWNDGAESGVQKKVVQQTREWRDAGVEVRVFLLSRRSIRTPADWSQDGVPVDVRCFDEHGGRFAAASELVRAIESWAPDTVYFRYNPPYPAFVRLAGSARIVVEVNTDDDAEYRLGSRRRYWYNRLTRGRFLKRCAGLVFVTRELANLDRYRALGKPMLVSGNGIRLAEFPQVPAPSNACPRLVFIGSPRHPWHGLDKIAWLAQQRPQWAFDVVGVPHDFSDEPNLRCHGVLRRSEYDRVMRSADVALGTLALHRKGMGEASPLKVREYLAYGIPTVIGYCDTDFPNPPATVLQLPNTEDNVRANAKAIDLFVNGSIGRRVQRGDVAHLDTAVKEGERLDFIRKVVRDTPRPPCCRGMEG